MPSLALACRLSAATAAIQSLFKRAKSIARRYNEPLLAIEDDFLELGPELVVNGDGNDATGWVYGGAVPSISNGELIATGDGVSYPSIRQAVPVIAGRSYLVSASVRSLSGVASICYFRPLGYDNSSSQFATQSNSTSVGVSSYGVVTAVMSEIFIRATISEVNSFSVAAFDNISVREVLSAQVYQDSAGTIPATIGSPIGLLTDRSYGGELGEELVANGGFDSDDGWTLSSNATAIAPTISGGKLIFNSPNPNYTFCRGTLNANLVIGKSYEISVNCLAYTAGTFLVAVFGETASILISGINSAGIKKVVFYATSANTRIEISRQSGSTNYVAEFDNISLRELKGNHATQVTAGNRPILTQYNGHPSASFNGTTNSLRLATNPIGSNLSQPYTIIVAGVVGALGAVRGFCGDGVRYFRIFESGTVGPSHAGIGDSLTTATLSAGQPFVVEIVYTGTHCSIWIDGVNRKNNEAFPPPTSGSASAFFIGHRGLGNEFFNGQITGISVFDRVLTDSERTTIGKAFAKELGVTYG